MNLKTDEKTRRYIMIRKYGREFLIWGLLSITLVLVLLGIVYVFEIRNYHVPGTRDMWIGLIGAVLGGMFTMIGVRVTTLSQEEQNEERKRLEYMPLLAFNLIEHSLKSKKEALTKGEPTFDGTFACLQGELCTTAFQFVEEKICKIIEISVLNNVCVFDFTIEGCLINGKEIHKGKAFSPSKRRLVTGEKYNLIFDDGDYKNTNEFCLIRFSYKDVFGNKYYQDLPFIYDEVDSYGEIKQLIQIRDIKSPRWIVDGEVSLEVSAKDYIDYEVFCIRPD